MFYKTCKSWRWNIWRGEYYIKLHRLYFKNKMQNKKDIEEIKVLDMRSDKILKLVNINQR